MASDSVLKRTSLNIDKWTKNLRALQECEFSERSITEYKGNRQRHFKAGYSMFRANKVCNIFIGCEAKTFLHAKAAVKASYTTKKEYDVTITIHLPDSKVVDTVCGCPMKGRCKHAFAVLWQLWHYKMTNTNFIEEESCTSRVRSWGIGKKMPSNHVAHAFGELKFIKHNCLKKQKKTYSNIEKRRQNIMNMSNDINKSALHKALLTFASSTNNAMLADVLSENHKQVSDIKTIVQNDAKLSESKQEELLLIPRRILWDTVFDDYLCTIRHNFPQEQRISLLEAQKLFQDTKQQSKSDLWHQARKGRITASSFGNICARTIPITDKFVDTIFKTNNKTKMSTKYMKIGLDNEEAAFEKYKISMNSLHNTNKIIREYSGGLAINPGCPFLGASPDRIVQYENGDYVLVEIKTLAKAMELNYGIADAICTKLVDFLYFDENRSIKFKYSSKQYYQIQGQMALTGIMLCDLVVDSGVGFYVERILFDENFWLNIMLPKLMYFYFSNVSKVPENVI